MNTFIMVLGLMLMAGGVIGLFGYSNNLEGKLSAAKEELAATKATIADLERKANPPKGTRTINLRVDDKDRTAWLGARLQCQAAVLMVENNADGDPSVRFSGCTE